MCLSITCHPYLFSEHFPQVGAEYLLSNILFCCFPLANPSLVQPHCAKHPKLCLYYSFSAQKSRLNTKNPSGIVLIPDGFHGGPRRISDIDLPGMNQHTLDLRSCTYMTDFLRAFYPEEHAHRKERLADRMHSLKHRLCIITAP